MLFSSGTFIFLFLPASLLGYQLLSFVGRRALLTWLALTSLFFYGYWNPKYLVLLALSILLNYSFSQLVGNEKSDKRSRWLVIAITSNLLLLAWFKYVFPLLGFFTREGLISHSFGNILLPLGISFFTFTQIAYLIDLRQDVAKKQDLLTYTVFVTFFPHLIAGPIIHPREIMPQLEPGRIGGLKAPDLTIGLSWFVMGLTKKVLIADRVAPLSDALYDHATAFGFTATWLGTLCYAVQLYFDFSGYSDMALGLARMFSIKFPLNFDSPYKSPSIIVFWSRWHMTLSRYLAEYLYTPILRSVNSRRMDAGKKVSRKAQASIEGFIPMVAFPLITTMFIAGIWHGAGMQFILFGVIHGVYLIVNHAWRLFTPKGHKLHNKLPKPLSVLITFFAVLIGQVFFRANGVKDALYVLASMTGLHGMGPSFIGNTWVQDIGKDSSFLRDPRQAAVTIAFCFFILWAMPNTQELLGQIGRDEVRHPSLLPRLMWSPSMLWSLSLSALFFICIVMLNANAKFLYFQF